MGVIYIDPFQMKEEPKDADFVLITHDHYNHLSPEDIGKVSNGGGIKLKEHRLFASKEEAEASIPKAKPKYRSPYE